MNDEVLTSIISNCKRQGISTCFDGRCVDVCVQDINDDTYCGNALQTPLLSVLMPNDPFLENEQTTKCFELFRRGYNLLHKANRVSVSLGEVGSVDLHEEPDGLHATYRFNN